MAEGAAWASLWAQLAAQPELWLAKFAGLLHAMFLVSLVFADAKRERLRADRLTHLDEAASFVALSLLVHAFVEISAIEGARFAGGS